MKALLVTIITPSYNQAGFIRETIESVLSQVYENVQYIIIDGGSTDGTRKILEEYNGRITWISEPDNGQAHALNKGLRLARGDIIGWLNSDDTYRDERTIDSAVNYFRDNPEAVMIYSDAYAMDENSGIKGKIISRDYNLQSLSKKCYIIQPTVFLRSTAVRRVGPFDESLMTCMDYDYWIRVGSLYDGRAVSYLKDTFLACTRDHRGSKTNRMRAKVYEEVFRVVDRHCHTRPITWLDGYIVEILLDGRRNRFARRALLLIRLCGPTRASRYIIGSLITIALRRLRRAVYRELPQ